MSSKVMLSPTSQYFQCHNDNISNVKRKRKKSHDISAAALEYQNAARLGICANTARSVVLIRRVVRDAAYGAGIRRRRCEYTRRDPERRSREKRERGG
eukprot:1855877-Rhodomonas_salina.3